MRTECDPQRRALGEQSQEQAEEADDEHGEVRGARPVIRGVLVRVTHRAGRSLVLRCVLRVADALWRVADKVQGPEDPVAEEQRADEQHG
jgi:hypothetical protein